MSLKLYAHPFSSYCQKVLIALYENSTEFEFRTLEDADAAVEFAAFWPLKRFPLLVDDGHPVMEASIIIEHLDLAYPGAVRFVPDDRAAALGVRSADRFFDNYIMTPQQKIVFDRLRPEDNRDPVGVGEARAMLETSYRWLEDWMTGREWAAGTAFSLADCAAAPALFYADWTHRIDPALVNVHDYRRRLLARPSFARAVNEARPYRGLFPLGAPNRD